MSSLNIRCSYVKDYPLVQLKGDLNKASIYSLNLVIQGILERDGLPVILDIGEQTIIGEDLKTLSCKGVLGCPFGCTIIMVGSASVLEQLSEVLDLPYNIHYAKNINEAIEKITYIMKTCFFKN